MQRISKAGRWFTKLITSQLHSEQKLCLLYICWLSSDIYVEAVANGFGQGGDAAGVGWQPWSGIARCSPFWRHSEERQLNFFQAWGPFVDWPFQVWNNLHPRHLPSTLGVCFHLWVTLPGRDACHVRWQGSWNTSLGATCPPYCAQHAITTPGVPDAATVPVWRYLQYRFLRSGYTVALRRASTTIYFRQVFPGFSGNGKLLRALLRPLKHMGYVYVFTDVPSVPLTGVSAVRLLESSRKKSGNEYTSGGWFGGCVLRGYRDTSIYTQHLEQNVGMHLEICCMCVYIVYRPLRTGPLGLRTGPTVGIYIETKGQRRHVGVFSSIEVVTLYYFILTAWLCLIWSRAAWSMYRPHLPVYVHVTLQLVASSNLKLVWASRCAGSYIQGRLISIVMKCRLGKRKLQRLL